MRSLKTPCERLEALIRWQHSERGMVNAADFIPVAEDTELIVPIGFWVFDEVCRQIRQWMDADPAWPAITVAVNLSARQLALPDLPGRLTDITERHHVPARMLELEITESVVMADFDRARDSLRHLRDLGFRISIDDFGTGYSSLAYLQRLPVDRSNSTGSSWRRRQAAHPRLTASFTRSSDWRSCSTPMSWPRGSRRLINCSACRTCSATAPRATTSCGPRTRTRSAAFC